jgi:hypothetical protein
MLYQQGKNKTAQKVTAKERNQDDIEFEKTPKEFKFAPEIHEINHKGTADPIVTSCRNKKKAG